MPVTRGIVVAAENEDVIVEVCVTVGFASSACLICLPTYSTIAVPVRIGGLFFGDDLGVPRSGTRCGRKGPCKAARTRV